MKIALTMICLLAGGCHLVLPLSPATDQGTSVDTPFGERDSYGERGDLAPSADGSGSDGSFDWSLVDGGTGPCPKIPSPYDTGIVSTDNNWIAGTNATIAPTSGTAEFSGLGSIYNNSAKLNLGGCGMNAEIQCTGSGKFQIVLHENSCDSTATCATSFHLSVEFSAGTPAVASFTPKDLLNHTFNTVELQRFMGSQSAQIFSLKMTTVAP